MSAPRQILAVLSFLTATLAAFALTQDWRPALAVGLMQAILLRIGVALHAGAPQLRAQVVASSRRAWSPRLHAH